MDYYNQIKDALRVKKYAINKSDLNTYYNVGKILSEAGKHYGEKIIKMYASKLKIEVNKKYSYRTLYRMRQFYKIFSNEKVSAMPTQLSWSHYTELLTLKNYDAINYYIEISLTNNLSYRDLHEKIKNDEYNRLSQETKLKLTKKDKILLKDLVKEPIVIKSSNNFEVISEKILKKLILEDIENFMKELGNSFCFIGSEYKIKIGDNYNYIDLLFFNIEYNCYVVVELKITELKKEHIGQIQVYMNYIDKNLKTLTQEKTIGIIICKKNNRYVIEYSSDERIMAKEYKIS